jgi:GDP-4-dehydro-6-deoxy-D-mannose reductase
MDRSSTQSRSSGRRSPRRLRVLITGASGFAGSWLARACAEAGDDVIGVSRSGRSDAGAGIALDLCDADAVRSVVRGTNPEVVYHLAALSSVGLSWQNPAETVNENVAMSVNMLEAVRLDAPTARVLWVSSCQVYGEPDQLPVQEGAPLRPENPYAVSKTAGEMLAGVYADAHGIDFIRARPFNHGGPGQREIFILGSLARQGAEARLAGSEEVEIVTGNPDARRDFTDVRDVVGAYRQLVSLPSSESRGSIFNVSSARSTSASELVTLLGEVIAPIRVRHTVDPARVRSHEVVDLRGSHARLTAATGWEPSIPLEQTMRDAVAWWERELAAAASR